MAKYDCIIIGAGPAGIFAALELVLNGKGLKTLIIEKGADLPERTRREIFCGWGGAGAFSDGKLNLSKDVGGFLRDYADDQTLDKLISYVDSLYLRFGAAAELKGTDAEGVKRLESVASQSGLRLISFPIRHIGTDRCAPLLKNIKDALGGKVDMAFNTEAAEVLSSSGVVTGVRTAGGREYEAKHVILCPGRAGSNWLTAVATSLGLETAVNPVDIGVRVEVPAVTLRHATDVIHEAKLVFNSVRFDDPVRTFCMNPYGAVVKERHAGFDTVNGHSYSTKRSDNTNFAILVSTTFTEPFKEPNAYGEYIARLANLLGGGIIVQRLGDLSHGRRSTPERIAKGEVRPTLEHATPGDLSFAIPYRHLSDILEMMKALDAFAPGVNSPSTLLYGVEVKFYSTRLQLSKRLETGVKNLFAAGDGAGVTRGIMQASVSGVIAAREILSRA